MTQRIRAIDLCAGVGGWACAARGLPIDVVLAVDFWPRACKTYELNHPSTEVLCGDIREPEVIARVRQFCGHVDLVLGGIPCGWLSVYRNVGHDKTRVSEDEKRTERRTLDNVLELIAELNPRWWCLEDVVGLVNELPPLTPWMKLDAAAYSAQRRTRVYVGRFPAPRRGTNSEVAATHLRAGPYRIGPSTFGRTPGKNRTFRKSTCLAAPPDEKSPTVCCWSSRRDAEVAVVDPRLPGGMRQFEWQEAARLQGFPEDYLFYGSPSDVWTMIGRAVQIDTARAILEAIVEENNSL